MILVDSLVRFSCTSLLFSNFDIIFSRTAFSLVVNLVKTCTLRENTDQQRRHMLQNNATRAHKNRSFLAIFSRLMFWRNVFGDVCEIWVALYAPIGSWVRCFWLECERFWRRVLSFCWAIWEIFLHHMYTVRVFCKKSVLKYFKGEKTVKIINSWLCKEY